MLVRDIDKKLDMRLVLKLRQNTDLFNALLDFKIKLPVFIYSKDEETWMSTYLPKKSNNPKIGILLKRFNALELDDAFVIDGRINNVKDLSVIDRLMEVPSFIVNRADMNSGYLNIYARFHSMRLDEVSQILNEYTLDSENARIEWLGPSNGIMYIMDLINKEYRVSLITYLIPMNGEGDPNLSSLKSDYLIEVANSLTKSGGFISVLYSDSLLNANMQGITAVSENDGVYLFSLHNQYLSEVRKRSNEKHINRIRFFVKPFGDRYEVTVFIPSVNIYEYYSIVYDVARKYQNTVTVKNILPYSPEIWDFI